MAVTNLRFNITSSWDGGGLRGAARALGSVDRDVNRVNRGFGRGAGGMQLWQKAAIALSPALFTLGKAALAGLGGVAALGVAVGGAVLPFVALGVTAAKNSEKMGAAGKAYETATSKVKTAWMDLAKRTAPLTLKPMTDVLDGLATAIPKLEPLVRRIAPVFADMGKSIKSWLQGPGFERFVSNLMDFGVPAFKNLVAAGKDFMATVGMGFRAFLPLAVDISEAIRRGAANLRDWASGGGFDRFLAGVKKEWPTVKSFLGELKTTMGNLGKVMNDIGPSELGGLSNLLEQFNKVDIDGWRSFLLTLAGLKIGGGLLSLIGALAGMRAGGLQISGAGALSGAAAALAAAGGTLLSAAAALEAAAASLAGAGAAAGAGGILGGIGRAIGNVGGGRSQTVAVTITPADAAVKLASIKSSWDGLKTAGTSVTFTATLVAGLFNPLADAVIAKWSAVKAAAATPAIFRAMAIPGNVVAVAGGLIAAWARVRAAAAAPAIFRASASPGNVVGVASSLVGAWSRVRAAAAAPAIFRAMVIAGPAVAGAAAVAGAWMRVLAMPRSWSATATVNAGGAVSGANAVRSAWSSVLAMPRSVTFTVNIVKKTTGGSAAGGPTINLPGGLAKGGSPNFRRAAGRVSGLGNNANDKVPAMLSRGEWVIRARAVRALGPDAMKAINGARSSNVRGGYGKPSGGGGGGGMGFGGGGDTVVHFHGKVYARSDAEFEDMVVYATKEAKRRNRI